MLSERKQHHIVNALLAVLLSGVLLGSLMPGCALMVETRPVLIEESDPVRIGPGVRGRVYFISSDGNTTLTDRETDIPEGWYAISPDLYELLMEAAGGQDAPGD